MASEQTKLSNRFLLFLVAGITILFFGLIKDYLMGVFWAIILALLFQGLHRRILHSVRQRRNLAAALSLVSVLLLVIIPVAILVSAAIAEGQEIAQEVQSEDFDLQGKIDELRQQLPTTLRSWGIPVDQISDSVTSRLSDLSEKAAGRVLGFTQGVLGFFIQLAVCSYVLFFFFRDGKEIIESFIRSFPMDDTKERQLIARFESVAKATMKGSLLIAVLQGVLGGILFSILGITGAVILGAIMIISALLPVGTILVWGPVALVLALQGFYTKALVVVIVGSMLIGVIDNVLRPRLVANDTKMPDYLILLSTLGGLTWFGLSGFVIGPIIAALFITCWTMLGDAYS
ncbi:MAG: AI-2E family transporter [Saprospiraceae bacterium]|nr:AI-2E family transporter [Saprospiraceae bacterium]